MNLERLLQAFSLDMAVSFSQHLNFINVILVTNFQASGDKFLQSCVVLQKLIVERVDEKTRHDRRVVRK